MGCEEVIKWEVGAGERNENVRVTCEGVMLR